MDKELIDILDRLREPKRTQQKVTMEIKVKLLAFFLGMMIVAGAISFAGFLVLVVLLLMKVPSIMSWFALFMLASAIVGGLIYKHL